MIEEASNEATADSNTRNMSDTLGDFKGDKRQSKFFSKKSKDHPPFLTGAKRDTRLMSGSEGPEDRRSELVKSLSQSHLLKVSKLGINPGREQNSSVQNDYSRIQNQTLDIERRNSAQTISSNSRLFRPSDIRKKKLKNFVLNNDNKAERNPYATLEKDVIQKSLNFLTIDEKMKYLRRDTHKTEETEKDDEFDLKNLNKLIINQIKSKRKMIEDIEHKKFKLSTIQAFDKTKSRFSSKERSKPMFDQKRMTKVPTSASTTKLPLLNDNTLMINTKEPLHPSASISAGIEKKIPKIQHKQGEESLKLYLKLFDSLKKRTLEKRAQEEGPLLVYGEKTNSTLSTNENFPYRRIRSHAADKYLNAVSVQVIKDSFPQLFYLRDEIGTKILNAFGINDEIDEFVEWEALYGFIKVAIFKEGNWDENSEFVIRFLKGVNNITNPVYFIKLLRQLLNEHFGNLKEKEEILQFMVAQYEECRVFSKESQTVNLDRLYSAFIDKLLDPSFLVNLILNSK